MVGEEKWREVGVREEGFGLEREKGFGLEREGPE